MLNKIEQSLKAISNFETKKYLLTVSGGMDSMALLAAFKTLKLDFGIAHCNFQLRGEESDLDEKLVRENSENFKYHLNKIDIPKYKEDKNISTQMAARETRYEWFNELATEHHYDYIVTAHHLNDQIETFFINLTRGTGIEGLTGINQFNGNIFRPMLSISRTEIKAFVNEFNIPYREDSSNTSTKYKRNKIRHNLIPILKELNPSFETTMANNFKIIEATNDIYKKKITSVLSSDLIITNESETFIKIDILLKLEQPQHYLFECIRNYNFNAIQANSIFDIISKKHISGKTFLSSSHKLVIDRDNIIISISEESSDEVFEIKKENKNVTYPVNLSFEILPSNETNIKPNSNFAFLDYDKIDFPIELRKWKNGDYFQPLGMKGKKKLSDFFIDKKLSLIEKESTYVLLSNNEIIWVIGQRISDLHKTTSETKTSLIITLNE